MIWDPRIKCSFDRGTVSESLGGFSHPPKLLEGLCLLENGLNHGTTCSEGLSRAGNARRLSPQQGFGFFSRRASPIQPGFGFVMVS